MPLLAGGQIAEHRGLRDRSKQAVTRSYPLSRQRERVGPPVVGSPCAADQPALLEPVGEERHVRRVTAQAPRQCSPGQRFSRRIEVPDSVGQGDRQAELRQDVVEARLDARVELVSRPRQVGLDQVR